VEKESGIAKFPGIGLSASKAAFTRLEMIAGNNPIYPKPQTCYFIF
jgi:hypothetical protein